MNKVKFLYALVCSIFLAACSEEENLMPAGRTGIQVALMEKATVETRKTPEELTKPLAKEFHLKITNAAGKSVYDAGYTSELIPASAGTYTVEATYGDNSELAVDAPYYKGEAEVEVTDGKTAKETIYCKVANALASVEFDNTGAYTFEDQFSSYGVKVEMGNLSTELKGDGESAYYRAGSRPTFTFVGTLKDGGEEVEVPLEDDKFSQAATFAAGAHCVITLKLGASTPGVRVEVSKVEVKDVTINETIPMEWLPKPKVEAEGFDVNNTLTFVETESKNAKLNLNLASALQEMKLKFNFEDPQFATLNEQEYLLSKDKATLESTLGITLPNIDDKEASIDLSALIDKLQTNAGAPTTNALTIDVQANNRWSSEDKEKELTYTLNCNKPEFSVAVQEGNCWSREFTIDEVTVTGNANPDKIKENLKYQYYNGTDWVDCTTRDNVVGRTQQFAETAEELTTKTYQVRALYRDAIASEVVNATLETPQQLPNSGMEEWHEEDQGDHKNLWFPYINTVVNSQWITNNMETTHSSSDAWDSPSAVKRTTVAHSGDYAAWIRTVGHGNTNTNVGSFLGMNGSITGTETIGVLSYSGEFKSRPTEVSFYYHYIQKGDDAGVIELKFENREENVTLFETNFTVTNSAYIQRTIPIEYSIFDVPITHLTLSFKSGSKHTEVVKAKVRGKNTDGTEADEHYGSELYIDDISLVYDK